MNAPNINFKEFREYVQNFKVAKDEVRPFLRQFWLEQAKEIIGYTKLKTPVGSPESTKVPGYIGGALRASWGIGEVDRLSFIESGKGKQSGKWDGSEVAYEDADLDVVGVVGNELVIILWNGMDYASHVEHGTPARPNWEWGEKGAQMLTVSMDEVYRELNPKFYEQFRQWCADRRVGS